MKRRVALTNCPACRMSVNGVRTARFESHQEHMWQPITLRMSRRKQA